ncbi:MAG: 1,4-dihydroxy-2-naphthoate polyprenyltransferase [Planctomycetota bacterium]
MRLAVWLEATRPQTLPAAAAPVLVGAALAFGRGAFHGLAVLAALVGALLIQIGTNYANDYFDHLKGADTEHRLGPRRATQAGLVTPSAMKRAFVVVFALAIVVGAYLVARAGWPIALVGLSAVLAGVVYTGGPYPLGYNGLGDVFVWIFFGPVAVGGTVYVQALDLTALDLVVGGAFGLLSTAILAVNNLRDADTDREVGKRTLAVRFGKGFARAEYAVCLALALALPLVLAGLVGRWALFSVVVLVPWAALLARRVRVREGVELNPLLGATGRFLVAYAVLFAIGWLA